MSSPASHRPFRKLRVAAVVDDFTRVCLEPEVTLLPLDARLWRLQLAWFQPDLVFVETAWRGHRGTWRGKVPSYAARDDRTLSRLAAYCRRRDIPAVFWNKEDPVLFDRFARSASFFDYVLTTDANMLDVYVERLGKHPDRVAPLMFAAQPALHHPRGACWEDVVCFAGSYGEPEFEQRRRDMDMLLEGAAKFDLRILDRTGAKGGHKAFPERWAAFLRPGVPYEELVALQRRYKVFLNVNTVRESPTMFSRRVFELLACGTSVVSSPSAGCERLFGDVVAMVSSREEVTRVIERLITDEAHRQRRSEAGVQRVMLAHTYEDRLAEVWRLVGLPLPPGTGVDVGAFAVVTNVAEARALAEGLERQELRPSRVAVALAPDSRARAAPAAPEVRAALGGLPVVDVIEPAAREEPAALRRRAADVLACRHIVTVRPSADLPADHLSSLAAKARYLDEEIIQREEDDGELMTAAAFRRLGPLDVTPR